MRFQPNFRPPDEFQSFLRFGVLFQFCLTLLLLHPYLRVDRVGIYHLIPYALSLHQCQSMNYCKELAYIVGAFYRTEMEYPCSCLQVNTLILHRSGISRTRGINSPSSLLHLHSLHPFRHLDAEQSHTVLDSLGNVGSYHQAHLLLLLRLCVEDREVVIELVECLSQLIAVIGYA